MLGARVLAGVLLVAILAGCAEPPAVPATQRPVQVEEDLLPRRLLSCDAEHRFLGPHGFTATRPTQPATWSWGLDAVVLDGDQNDLVIPLLDPVPGGWSALVVSLHVQSDSGSFAVPPSPRASIHLREPSVYVAFDAPTGTGFDGHEEVTEVSLDPATSIPLPARLGFDAGFLSTGEGVDLALVSHPGETDAAGRSMVSRVHAFYCGGERLRQEEFLGFDAESHSYRR